MPRETTWYIDIGDAHTNEVVSRLLQAEIPATNCRSSVLCIDGVSRDLWEVKYSTVTQLKNSKFDLKLKFTVFKRDGRYGPVRKWDFPKKKLPHNQQETKEWLNKLAERKNKKS